MCGSNAGQTLTLQVGMVVMLAGKWGGVVAGRGHDRGLWGGWDCSELDLGSHLGDLLSNTYRAADVINSFFPPSINRFEETGLGSPVTQHTRKLP